MRASATLAAIVGALCMASPAIARSAKDAPLQPAQMVRSLQLVQDRVAAGDHAALPIQRKLLEMIDARLRGGSDEELSEPAGFRATLVYAMSGGNPATLETVLDRLQLDEPSSRKALGVLSYLKGNPKASAVALSKVDPMKEQPELGAFLALVKGSVIALEDPKGALKLLDQGRLLAPGTLVEEAALRRFMPLAAETHEPERFLLASEQYVRSYLPSPYASQFADSFVAGVVALHDTIDLKRVEEVVRLMSPQQQQVIYLRIARRSAIDGLAALSTFASERTTVAAAPATSDKDPRALLYASLAGATTEPLETLRANLARIDRRQLSKGDLELLDAVTAISDQITSAPQGGGPAEPQASKAWPPSPASPTSPAPAELAAVPEEQLPPVPEQAPLAQPAPVRTVLADPGIPETAPEPAAEAPIQAVRAPDPAVVEAEAPPAEAVAVAEPTTNAEATEPPTVAKTDPADPADIALAEGRKKLDEIDELLAKATK